MHTNHLYRNLKSQYELSTQNNIVNITLVALLLCMLLLFLGQSSSHSSTATASSTGSNRRLNNSSVVSSFNQSDYILLNCETGVATINDDEDTLCWKKNTTNANEIIIKSPLRMYKYNVKEFKCYKTNKKMADFKEKIARSWGYGIKNTGNTCYLNSLTQCLYATLPLHYMLWRFPEFAENYKENQQVVNWYKLIYKPMINDVVTDFVPLKNSVFTTTEQDDSSDALGKIIDHFNDKNVKNNDGKVIKGKCDITNKEEKDINKNTNIVFKSFQFSKYLETTYNAHGKTPRVEIYYQYRIIIKPSVSKCFAHKLQEYFKENQTNNFTKTSCMCSLPEILFFECNRYDAQVNGGLIQQYAFPLYFIFPEDLVSIKDQERTYVLYAVSLQQRVNKDDDQNNGHYRSLTRKPWEDKWKLYDDASVLLVNNIDTFLNEGRMYFYIRRDIMKIFSPNDE